MAELIEKIKISELTETTTADDASYIPIDNGNVTYKITVANYNSGANATAKSYAEASAASATAAAGSATYVENALDEVQNIYSDFEDEKLDLLNQFSSITQSVQSASNSATRAAASATSAATSAQNCATIETSVREGGILAESWAVGGTNTREGEDTNNSKYYAEQASAVASDLPNLVGPAVEGYLDDHPVQAPVTSVNNQTGDVVLDIPAEVTESTVAGWGFTKNTGTYSKPNTGIPATDLATAVQTSLEKADTALQSAPVTSVNGKTGAVVLTASDVNALPSTTVIPTATSDLTNDSNFVSDANYVHTDNNFTTAEKNKLNGIESGAEVNAVNSVNGEVGDVTIAVPTKTSQLQNDSGFLTAIISTASGDPATVSDGADNILFKSVAVNIAPLQSGSGDPSPDNIRPISGWTAVNVVRTGKNLLPVRITSPQTINGVTITPNSDGSYKLTGTATGAAVFYLSNLVDLWESGQYALTGCPSGGGNNIFVLRMFTTDGVTYATDTGSGITFSGRKQLRAAIVVWNGVTIDATFYPMIRPASITDATYEPYTAQTYPVTLPTEAGTVYGGTLDVIKGTLTVDRAFLVVKNMAWARSTSYAHPVFYINQNGKATSYEKGACSFSRNISRASIVSAQGFASLAENGDFALSASNSQIYVRYDDITDVNTFKTQFADETFVYPLATPTTYTLTPTEIRTLLGHNTLWADAGAVNVQYPADTKLYIDGKIAELQALVLENNG